MWQVDSSSYQAFASPSYPELAIMGVDIDWKPDKLLVVPLFSQTCMNDWLNVPADVLPSRIAVYLPAKP